VYNSGFCFSIKDRQEMPSWVMDGTLVANVRPGAIVYFIDRNVDWISTYYGVLRPSPFFFAL